MASMNLAGPYPLSFDKVASVVKPRRPGVFALGYKGDGGVFFVNYIGRSDSDLRERLLEFIGSDVSFKFEVAASAQEAFMRECELFHAFRPRGNRMHPSRAPASEWKCPRCALLELP